MGKKLKIATGKEEKREAEEKEDMGEVVQGRRTLKIGRCGEISHAVATPD